MCRYLNFPYIIRGAAPWDIVDVWAKPMELPLGTVGHGFVFTSSILLSAIEGGEEDVVTISYNVNDRASMFLQRPLGWFLDGMASRK